MKQFFIILLFLWVALSCQKSKDLKGPYCNSFQTDEITASRVTVTQGIYGVISFTQGNCMPGFGEGQCSTCPVERTVRCYEYTRITDAIADETAAGFFTIFNTRLVAETTSDVHGFYQLNLPPGTYSLVVVENGKLYTNFYDGQKGINPITIGTGKLNVNFPINYKAVY